MLKTFGKHPYLPLLHGLAKDHDGLLLVALAPSILHHSAIYVYSYYYICVLILIYAYPHTTVCVLILLCLSSYYYMCPHTTLSVMILVYMCPLLGSSARS
jgi:hypothetical protein